MVHVSAGALEVLVLVREDAPSEPWAGPSPGHVPTAGRVQPLQGAAHVDLRQRGGGVQHQLRQGSTPGRQAGWGWGALRRGPSCEFIFQLGEHADMVHPPLFVERGNGSARAYLP